MSEVHMAIRSCALATVLKDVANSLVHLDRCFQMTEAGVSDDPERVGG